MLAAIARATQPQREPPIMNRLPLQLSYRMIRFAAPDHDGPGPLYVGVAWNYGHGQLMSTPPLPTYTDARIELDRLAGERACQLRWFDGEYECTGRAEDLVPVAMPTLGAERECELVNRRYQEWLDATQARTATSYTHPADAIDHSDD